MSNIKIVEIDAGSIPSITDDDHILTYAEEGFSPLTLHCRKFRIDRKAVTNFVSEVNSRNETGSLHPKAPISAIPRHFIREPNKSSELENTIREFLIWNESLIKSKRLFIDFGCPRNPPNLMILVNKALNSLGIFGLVNIYIVIR